MKKLITVLLLFMMVHSAYALGQKEVKADDPKELRLTCIQTVLNGIEHPDDFFIGTSFEKIKPTQVLNGKDIYNYSDALSEMDLDEKFPYIHPNSELALVSGYFVSKKEGKYNLFFNCDNHAYAENPKTVGATRFTVGDALETFAANVASQKKLSDIQNVKMRQAFTVSEFNALSKEIIQETADYVETICLVNGNYLYLVFRKIYA